MPTSESDRPRASLPPHVAPRGLLKLGCALAAALLFDNLALDPSLTPQAQGVLSALVFMVIVWVTEAVSFAASSIYLLVAMTLFTGFAAAPDGTVFGTRKALSLAVSGYVSAAWFLVVAALFLAAAIQQTGLGRRLALVILSRAGTRPRRMRGGILALCFALTLFIPAQAANAVLMTAVCSGLLLALSIRRASNLAKGLMLTVGFGCPLAGLGVLTSGAPPIQTADLIFQSTGHAITWLQWMLYGMPFALVLGGILFLLIDRLFPVPPDDGSGGDAIVRDELARLGPMSGKEKRLLVIMGCTIFLWSTGGVLHSVDTTTAALLAVAAVFLPGIGVAGWDDVQGTVSWGTLLLFGGAISLGQALLTTGAAAWVAGNTLARLGLASWPLPVVIGAGGLLFGLFALAFSARAAAVAALVPTAIAFAQSLPPDKGVPVWGFTVILYYAVQFAIVLPVNTPMSMVAYSTGTFTVADMVRVGIPLCLAALVVMVLFSMTYWQWVGLL